MSDQTPNQPKRKRIYTRFWFQAVLTFLIVTGGMWGWYLGYYKPIEEINDVRFSFLINCIENHLFDADEYGGCSGLSQSLADKRNIIIHTCLRPGESLSVEAIIYDASLFSCMEEEGLIPFY